MLYCMHRPNVYMVYMVYMVYIVYMGAVGVTLLLQHSRMPIVIKNPVF